MAQLERLNQEISDKIALRELFDYEVGDVITTIRVELRIPRKAILGVKTRDTLKNLIWEDLTKVIDERIDQVVEENKIGHQ
jgi:hypothetical protein